MSLLEVSVASGQFGPVLVLAGEADLTSATRLDEVLAAPTATAPHGYRTTVPSR